MYVLHNATEHKNIHTKKILKNVTNNTVEHEKVDNIK